MIAKLTGIVDSLGEEAAVIDVGGVGYLVFCPARTLRALPAPGGRASLSIETHVREDHIHLYGFADALERAWFRRLMAVQGVGARVALAILGVLDPARLAGAVMAGDAGALTAAPGVGRKLAQRVVAELRDRMPELAPAQLAAARAVPESAEAILADAVSALVNLGYRESEAFGAVSGAARTLGEAATLEGLIKAGLRELHA